LLELGYTEEWIQQNKIIIPKESQPTLADGLKLDAYGIPAMRMTIDEHEILHNDYFLTSDHAPGLGFLLGADILSYFDVFFKYSERKVYYEFRSDRKAVPSNLGDSFAYEATEEPEKTKEPEALSKEYNNE